MDGAARRTVYGAEHGAKPRARRRDRRVAGAGHRRQYGDLQPHSRRHAEESLPVEEPDRLVLLHWHGETWPRGLNQSGSGGPANPAYKSASRSQAYPFFREVRNETSLFDAVFAFAPLGSERQNTTLAAEGGAERVDGEMVSGEYFRGLRVSPVAGRLISTDADA